MLNGIMVNGIICNGIKCTQIEQVTYVSQSHTYNKKYTQINFYHSIIGISYGLAQGDCFKRHLL